MMRKRKNNKDLFEEVGRKYEMSAEEARKEMEKTIMEAYHNPDQEKQTEFKKRFGGRIPSPEEFIYSLAIELRTKNSK